MPCSSGLKSALLPKTLECVLFWFLVFAVTLSITSNARAQSKEYQVKAAFLFNFVQFVQWPTNAFPNADAPFTIGILGEDPFGRALEEIVQGETVQGHKIVIRRSRHLQELEDCQMIFVSKSERGRINDILTRLNGRAILTVGDMPGFASRGGIINFYAEGPKVRFEINPAATQREGLKISSQLLSLGKIVGSEVSKGSP